jgi:polar amino acid transport system substrate-binding protein
MNSRLRQCALSAVLAALLGLATFLAAGAQQTPQPPRNPVASPQAPVPPEPPVTPSAARQLGDPTAVPGFWDPRRRPERPDLSRITIIRFLTETDYPPFDFAGPDGAPAGFNVDLARLICEEMKVPCTVQMRRFDTLIKSLDNKSGDAVIASIAETPETRLKVDFSDPYYRTPARFVSRRDVEIDDVRPQALEGRKIGVVAGTAHEAYLKALRSPSGSTAPIPATVASSVAGRFWRAAISARASASRSNAATTSCGRRSTGRCSSCGRRAASPTCG